MTTLVAGREPGVIYEKMPLVAAAIESVAKSRRNTEQGAGYNYRGVDDLYNAVHGPLAANGVSLIYDVLKHDITEVSSSRGTKGLHWVVVVHYRFCAEDGSHMGCTTIGEATAYDDKGFNKAMQQAMKMMLTQVFTIPTGDPDADGETPPEATERAPRSSPNDPITQSQGEWIAKAAKFLKPEEQNEMVALRESFGAEKVKDLTKRQASKMIDAMKEYGVSPGGRETTIVEDHPDNATPEFPPGEEPF